MKNRLVVRKGKIVQKNNNLINTNTNANYKINEETLVQSEDKEIMDDRFDDVLKVNRNNPSSDIYKKYEMLKKQESSKKAVEINDAYKTNASFYSALKTKTVEETTEEKPIVQEDYDPTEIDHPDIMFDLFNLNIKDSNAENLYQEKKLVNNNKQKIIDENNQVVTVKVNNEPNYSFQKDDELNYQDTFKDLRKNKEKTSTFTGKFNTTYTNNSPVNTVDLKNKLYSEGYKIRTYQKLESENFYSTRYYLSNKLARDCSIITALIMMFIIGIMWLAFDSYVKLPVYTYLSLMAACLILPLIFLIKYYSSPKTRKPSDFSFKLAILNAIMAYLIGIVFCMLVAFFGVGADITDISTLVCPLIYPMFVMLVLPIFVIVYQLLYISKRYFVE